MRYNQRATPPIQPGRKDGFMRLPKTVTPLQTLPAGSAPARRVARLWVWLAGALLILAAVVLVVCLWPNYRRLAAPCPNLGPCSGSSLTVAEAAFLAEYGLSMTIYAGLITLIQLATNLGFLGIATVLFLRRRDDPMAICTVAVFALLAINLAGYPALIVDFLGRYAGLVDLVHGATIGAIILFYALFPTGTFVPRFLRRLAPLLIAVYSLALLLIPLIPSFTSPIQRYQLTLALQTAALGLMVAAQIYRYRRYATPEQRRQTAWMIGCSLTYTSYRLGSSWFFQLTGIVGSERHALLNISLIVLLHVLELAIVCGAIVMLRRGFYRLGRLAGRTVVYALLTICIIALYVVLVGGLSLLLRPERNALVALLVTGIIAVAFQPLRAALQRGVNQLFYGRRDDPREVIAALGRQLEGALAADVVLPTIVQTVARELKLPYAAIVLDDRDDPAAASVGAPAEPLLILPLSASGAMIGRLFVAARAPNEAFTLNERLLLEDLARQAGVAVRAARLNHELQRSRERLVAAREEERRRLQRDLHDELGPTLAGLSMQLDAARASLTTDPAAGEALLAEVQVQLREAVSTVRRIVHHLRPPLLDQLGLLGAIRETALRMERNSGTPVRLELPAALPLLSAATEAAAYYIVAEALTNTARHAGAGCCIIRVTVDTMLQIEVADDGTGVAAQAVAGVGLRSMRERAEELGGTWTLTAAASGTLIRARLPVRP